MGCKNRVEGSCKFFCLSLIYHLSKTFQFATQVPLIQLSCKYLDRFRDRALYQLQVFQKTGIVFETLFQKHFGPLYWQLRMYLVQVRLLLLLMFMVFAFMYRMRNWLPTTISPLHLIYNGMDSAQILLSFHHKCLFQCLIQIQYGHHICFMN